MICEFAMAKTFRLTDEEEKALNNVQLKINRELVKNGQKPLRDTEILHEILRQTILSDRLDLSHKGYIIINNEAYKSYNVNELNGEEE